MKKLDGFLVPACIFIAIALFAYAAANHNKIKSNQNIPPLLQVEVRDLRLENGTVLTYGQTFPYEVSSDSVYMIEVENQFFPFTKVEVDSYFTKVDSLFQH